MSHGGLLDDDCESGDEGHQKVDDSDEYQRGCPTLPWGIRKKVLREAPVDVWAEGRPKPGDRVAIRYEAKLQDGTRVGSSGAEPFEYVINQTPREVIVGMDWSVQTMRRTEKAQFEIAPRLAYDDLGSPPAIPPGATLVFEIELLRWETQEDLFGDGSVVKTVAREGHGEEAPQRGQEVIVSFTCRDRKGEVVEQHDHLEHTVGDPSFGPLSRVIVTALQSMTEGERSTLAISRDGLPGERRFAKATVEIELERVFETADVSLEADGSLLKKVLRRGSGDKPLDGSRVKVRVASATDGSKALPGFAGSKVLEFTLGHGEVCDALEFAAAEMALGEEATLTGRPAGRFVEPELGLAAIDADKVVLGLELLGIGAGGAGPAGPVDCLEAQRARKARAAGLYRRQRFSLALYQYDKILDSFAESDLSTAGPESEELHLQCLLNRAACLLKLERFQAAKDTCDRILEKEPDDLKALFRRASALLELSEYSDALRDLYRVLTLEPKNMDARVLATKVKERRRHYAKEAQRLSARMLDAQAGERGTDGADAAAEEAAEKLPPDSFLARAGSDCLSLAALSACLPQAAVGRLADAFGLRARG